MSDETKAAVKNQSQGLLDCIYDNIRLVKEFRAEMLSLAKAADQLGQTGLAQQFRYWPEPLTESAKAILDAWQGDLDSRIKHNEAMLGNMLDAMLHPATDTTTQTKR